MKNTQIISFYQFEPYTTSCPKSAGINSLSLITPTMISVIKNGWIAINIKCEIFPL